MGMCVDNEYIFFRFASDYDYENPDRQEEFKKSMNDKESKT